MHAITIENNLDILFEVEVPKNDPTLPSWVPDWRETLTRSLCRSQQTDQNTAFSATSNLRVELDDYYRNRRYGDHQARIIVKNPEKLTVKGFRMVRITDVEVSCSALGSAHLIDIVGNRGTWSDMARHSSKKGTYTPTGEKISSAFMRTRLYLSQSMKPADSTDESAKPSMSDGIPDDSLSRFHESCAHQKFFWAEDGYFGLGPITTRVGDMICLLLGGRMPFILRPATEGSMTFVGAAYAHGLMYGEGGSKEWKRYNVENRNLEPLPLEWVTLV